MALLETGVRNALLASTAIASAVSGRVRPLGMARDEARPYITYQVSHGQSEGTLNDGPDDYRIAEFEIAIFADRYDTVMVLSNAAREKLDQFGETISGVEFAPCMFDGESDIEEAIPEGQEQRIYVRVQTYRALYKLHQS